MNDPRWTRKGIIVGAALLATSCTLPLSVPAGARIACETGAGCPVPLVCLSEEGVCVDVDAACVDVDVTERSARATADGSRCATVDGGVGVCRSGRCGGACGDGVTDPSAGELCDLGDENSDTAPDGCRTNCLPARCGDGVVDQGESCDDDTPACEACLAVCALETADADGIDGCEAPLSPVARGNGFLVSPIFVEDGGLPSVVYATATGPNQLRRLNLDTNQDNLITNCPDFCQPVASSTAVAFTAGSQAEVFLVVDGVPVSLFDGSSVQAMSDEGLYVIRTDGNTEFLSRTDLVTRVETRLDGDLAFPPALAVTSTRVVWSRAEGGLAARPLGGGLKETFAPEIISPSLLFADGDDVWVLDDLNDLWLVTDAGATRVLERPAAFAGARAQAASARDGTWAISWFFGGENFEDGDDVGSILVGDAFGSQSMRARTNGFLPGVFIDDTTIHFAGDGVFGVPR